MPWCGGCVHYFAPSAVRADGTCPRCGAPVDPGGLARTPAAPAADPAVHPTPEPAVHPAVDPAVHPGAVPWHFKAFLVAFALYLGFRAWQLVEAVSR
jgi:hypothetical protein